MRSLLLALALVLAATAARAQTLSVTHSGYLLDSTDVPVLTRMNRAHWSCRNEAEPISRRHRDVQTPAVEWAVTVCHAPPLRLPSRSNACFGGSFKIPQRASGRQSVERQAVRGSMIECRDIEPVILLNGDDLPVAAGDLVWFVSCAHRVAPSR